ncbi:hypothetical protein GYMLUDRAFT_242453 [Collybiopsis luxurians FD-317 M1]|uniref:Uncharacterized protein n=1 Tax=Collybiopsis luxurians FD-317 M1 TaxID=944289 RepID=A0A0D0BFX0_9AGAR|nr:hypothetical protein GYMLUDRAFT_242453 [Collybiopsis luxurians FD-317 M1]
MKFTTVFAISAALLSVSATPLQIRDGWDPIVTSPVPGTVWTIATLANITPMPPRLSGRIDLTAADLRCHSRG